MAKLKRSIAILCLLAVIGIHSAESSWTRRRSHNSTLHATFQNPIVDHFAADPSMIKLNGFYYLALSIDNAIFILKSSRLTDFRNAERKEIYRAPPGRGNLWAPEIQQIRGNIYVYFTMDDGVIDQNHRMYVIRAFDPQNPMGQWNDGRR